MTAPLYQQTFAHITSSGSISFGSGSTLADLVLDGSHSFSVCFTFRMAQFSSSDTLFSKGSQFSFGLQNGVLFAQLANATAVVADAAMTLQPNTYYSVMCTYDSAGPNSGTLTLSVAGAQAASAALTNAGIPDDGSDFVFGGQVDVDLVGLCLWNIAVPMTECLTSKWMMPDPGTQGLVSCYCFADGPPSDDSGNNHPITFLGGGQQVTIVPGFQLENNAYVVPATSDALNPGGGGNVAFSLLAWVYCTGVSSGSQYSDIFGNCDANSGIQMGLGQSDGSLTLTVLWNGLNGSDIVSASTSFAANAWHHVAVTYDGTTFTLYVDGQECGSAVSGTMNMLSTPAPVIGGAIPLSTAPNNNPFQGYIGALQVWSTALSADDVATYMAADPAQAQGCVANFRGLDSSNGVTGTVASLNNGARVSWQSTSGGLLSRSSIRAAASNPKPRWPDIRATAAQAPDEMGPRPKSRILSETKIDQLIADYEEILGATGAAQPQIDQLRKVFLNNLYSGIRHYDDHNGRPPGLVLHRRDGDDHVFEVVGEDGLIEAARIGDATLASYGQDEGLSSECIAWYILLIANAIMVIIGAIGLGAVGSSVISKFLTEWAPKVLSNLIPAMRLALAEANNFQKLIKVVFSVYICGGLASVLAISISGLHWWNWVFIVVAALADLIMLWATGGWYLAAIVANMTASITYFVTSLLAEPEGGCTPGRQSANFAPA
ncbi:hypothetical protein J2Z31_005337 [Sinorhizobium kostiense]|uniref:LamG-like jellyroll fold domain-containing protein n=1 Tax=Sinorhizobium kostiense TaxID=76747 RepID=A0ABS4R8T8_9HYPH|nr:LamG domain-containing protein [Sinorhizobium kostiense]MBP2238796.1 hypothetical protein [Sinorhizobium kostiense]